MTSTRMRLNRAGEIGELEEEFCGRIISLTEIRLKHLELMQQKGVLRKTDFSSYSDEQLKSEMETRNGKYRVVLESER